MQAAQAGKTAKLLKKAANKHKNGRYSEAEMLYQKILKLDTQHIDANYLLGTLYAEQKKLQQAASYMGKAQDLAPQSEYIKNNLGNVYRMLGDYPGALTCYQQALCLNPAMPEALNNLAIVYRHLNDIQLAVESYRKAISVKPDFVEAHWNLGKAYVELNRQNDAEACFQRVLEINSKHAGAHYELGGLYLMQQKKQLALQYLENYMQLDPQDQYGAGLKLAYLNGGEMPEQVPFELIRQSYERKACQWDADVAQADKRFLGPQHVAAALNALGPQNVTGLQVLDLGCGTGLCGENLRPLSSLLVGVDLSEPMLAQARRKNVYDHLECADIDQYLDDKDNSFDIIVASGVLIFFGPLTHILQRIFTALKTSGYFVFTLYKNAAGENIKIRDNIHFGHGRDYVRQQLEQIGFKPLQIQEVVHEYVAGIPQTGFCVIAQKA